MQIGYLLVRLGVLALYAHRIAWALYYGTWPEGEVDHVNGDRADNRLENLRVVTKSQNMRNCFAPSTNTSGVFGASWCKRKRRWVAQIRTENGTRNLGYFDTAEEAGEARRAASRLHGYSERHGTIK